MPLDTVYASRDTLAVILDKDHEDYTLIRETIPEKVKEYERRVWSDGLQDVVEKHPSRGMAGSLDGTVKIMTYVLAGRVMTTFEHKDGYSVTVLSGEGEKPSRMGFHGISGTPRQALALLQLAIDVWEREGINIVADTDVTLDVLAAMRGPAPPKPRMAQILDLDD